MSVEQNLKELPTNWVGDRDEAAAVLGVHPNSVSRYVARGLLRWDASRGPRKGDERVSRKELYRFVQDYFLGRKVGS